MSDFPVLLADGLPFDFNHLAIRLLHVGAAMLAVGAAVFQWRALHPALQTVEPAVRRDIRESVAARWSIVIVVCIGLLLISGFYNFITVKIPLLREHPSKGLYHGLFGVKFLFALASFHAAAVLALPGSRGEKYREKAGFWLQYLVITLSLTFLVAILLASFR